MSQVPDRKPMLPAEVQSRKEELDKELLVRVIMCHNCGHCPTNPRESVDDRCPKCRRYCWEILIVPKCMWRLFLEKTVVVEREPDALTP